MMAVKSLRSWTCVLLSLSPLALGQGSRYPDCLNGPLKNNSVCRTSLPPAERAAALVAAMTIDEKLVNLVE